MKTRVIISLAISLFSFAAQAEFAGNAACLSGAKDWVYRNTSSMSSESAEKAMDFCARGGDVSCLTPTKDWLYRNTSSMSSEAAAKALEMCKGQSRCRY